MRKDLIDIVCCPDCKGKLSLHDAVEDDHHDIASGRLHCKKCAFDFPIEDGIPNLLPQEYHLAS